MRRAGLTLSALLAAAPVAPAQAPQGPQNLAPVAPPPASPVAALNPAAVPPPLTAHLAAWEKRHKQVQNLYTPVERETKNLIGRKSKTYAGEIMCLKPNMAWLKVVSKENKADWQAYICDGRSVYEYNSDVKEITEHRIPKQNPNSVGDNLLLEFMSGAMTADDVVKRFDLTLVKEEEHYVHLLVKPRLPRDLQEFESMLIVLHGPKTATLGLDYLPKLVIMRTPNGQVEETWTFAKPQANVSGLTAANFAFVKPDGWRVKPAAAAPGGPPPADPKLARPAAPGK